MLKVACQVSGGLMTFHPINLLAEGGLCVPFAQAAAPSHPAANLQSTPAPSSQPGSTQLPAPSGLQFSFQTSNSWQGDGGITYYQHDLRLQNIGSSSIPAARMVIQDGSAVTQCWNVEDGHSGGQRCWSFPAWLQQNGGLKPGDSLAFGGIFKGIARPQIAIT